MIVELPDGGIEAAVAEALAQLIQRGLVAEGEGLHILPGQSDLVAFQAGSVEQHLTPAA